MIFFINFAKWYLNLVLIWFDIFCLLTKYSDLKSYSSFMVNVVCRLSFRPIDDDAATLSFYMKKKMLSKEYTNKKVLISQNQHCLQVCVLLGFAAVFRFIVPLILKIYMQAWIVWKVDNFKLYHLQHYVKNEWNSLWQVVYLLLCK